MKREKSRISLAVGCLNFHSLPNTLSNPTEDLRKHLFSRTSVVENLAISFAHSYSNMDKNTFNGKKIIFELLFLRRCTDVLKVVL